MSAPGRYKPYIQACINIQRMDPPDEWRHAAQDDTPGETLHTDERSKIPPSHWEDSRALLVHPAGRPLDMQLQLGQTLCTMILFVPFALDMVSSYLSVLREYLKAHRYSWPRHDVAQETE